jgi:AcrR family transcriptional regulator
MTRKNDLMQAGMNLFAKKGYHGTKVSDIVKEAGVAQGTFYLYFDSKPELFAALLDKFVELIFSAVAAVNVGVDTMHTPADFAASIREAVHAVLVVFRDNGALARIVLREASTLEPDLQRKWEQAIDRLADLGKVVLDSAVKRNFIPPQNTKIVPYCVLGMYERVAFRWLVEDDSTDIHELVDALTRYEMLGIGGVGTPDLEAAIVGESHSPDVKNRSQG